MDNIQNPGSAIGEAIGTYLEIVLNRYISDLVEKYYHSLISKGKNNVLTGKSRKLLMYDNAGIAYNIDAVVVSEDLKPIILLEYKYIRYTKHNRDKGSWLCTAHNEIRKRYSSVRSSIAVLAGNWSISSIAMMQSHNINIFIIPFAKITNLLKGHNIKFDWDEKDRETALNAWNKYSELTEYQKQQIAEEMIQEIKPNLEASIEKILDNSRDRSVESVNLEIRTNIGEAKYFEFLDIAAAIDFLEDFTFDEIFDTTDAYSIFEGAPVEDDNKEDNL